MVSLLHTVFIPHVLTLLETTSNASAFTLYLLSIYKDAEEKVLREIQEHIGKRTPDFDDLKKVFILTYQSHLLS
jgi:hypothetical protein